MPPMKTVSLGLAMILGVISVQARGDSIRSEHLRHLHHEEEVERHRLHHLGEEVSRLTDHPSHSSTHTAALENLATIQFPSTNTTPSPASATITATAPAINVTGTSFASALGSSAGSATPSPASADAFINFGSGPYPEANSLTTGNGQAFFNSPVFTHLFPNNAPTASNIVQFENQVVSTIQQTYNNAGLAIHLTTDPNTPAAHTMSVVSGTSYSGNPNAIGITDVGNNGFSFIDKFAGVQTEAELATAIGHNLSHELMHAFGIANHPEQVGPYVDAATTTLSTLTDPTTGFSPAAAALLSTLNFQDVGQSVTAGAQKIDGDQVLIASPTPAPEPATMALWTLAGVAIFLIRPHRRTRPIGL